MHKLIALVLACACAVHINLAHAGETPIDIIPAAERQHAADFTLDTLQGGQAALADHKGRLVLLNFWATWCLPCRQEMPGMEALWRKYQSAGLSVLAVSIDEGAPDRVARLIKKLDLSFPVLLDPADTAGSLYKVSDLPVTFLLSLIHI